MIEKMNKDIDWIDIIFQKIGKVSLRNDSNYLNIDLILMSRKKNDKVTNVVRVFVRAK